MADVAADVHRNELEDMLTVIDILISDFKRGLFSSNTSPAVKAFKQLINRLENCYTISDAPAVTASVTTYADPESEVKWKIIQFLLSIRVNHLAQVGISLPNQDKENQSSGGEVIEFSPFVICGTSELSLRSAGSGNNLSPPLTPNTHGLGSLAIKLTELSLSDMFRVLLLVLEKEKDWQIIRTVLSRLKTLISKNPVMIILTKSPNKTSGRIGKSVAGDIVSTGARLIHDKSRGLPDSLVNMDRPKFTKSEFDRHVYPLLESLIVYGRELDSNHQTELLKAIQVGLQNRSYNRHTMLALTCCLMEMQDQKVIKYLPDLLLKISQISATRALAVPKMSFLSTLVLFPQMYSSFTADQYMSIFAIAVPYTNYSEFDEFTIALAHRVIAMWFLNCKLEARAQFASFIRKNLVQHLHSISSEEDMRGRSHSVGTSMKRSPDYAVRVPQTPTATVPHVVHPHHIPLPTSPIHTLSPAPHSASSNAIFFSENSLSGSASVASVSSATTGNSRSTTGCSMAAREILHRELFEACMDLLSRYTHGMCSSVPRQNPLADFIIDRETAMTWFVGQSLITIAVSHCGAKAVDKGLCSKCSEICNSVRTSGSQKVCPSTSSDVDAESDRAFSNYAEPVKSGSGSGKSGRVTFESQRRRHQSAIDSRRVSATKPENRAFDDIHLESVSSSSSSGFVSLNTSGQKENCQCWCQGWAEVTERRPTGKTSFMMRIENSLNLPCYCPASGETSVCQSLVKMYNPRILNQNRVIRSDLHNIQVAEQVVQSSVPSNKHHTKSHTVSTNQAPDSVPGEGETGISSSSSGSPFRRTSSSPEIEHNNRIYHHLEEAEVEEAKEVRDDDMLLGQSPSKGLSRTVSLGKAERPTSVPSPGGSPLTRAASFTSKQKSPMRVIECEEPISNSNHHQSWRANCEPSAATSGVMRVANKKNLTIKLESESNGATYVNGDSGSGSGSGQSPSKGFKSSPKSPTDKTIVSQSEVPSASSMNRKESAPVIGTMSPTSQRERAHTFSANPMNNKKNSSSSNNSSPSTAAHSHSNTAGHHHHNPYLHRQAIHTDTHTKSMALSPSFFFLRLYYNPSFNESEIPILLPSGCDAYIRNIRVLDLLTPFETHKVGVVYVAPDQKQRHEILANEHGSVRYQKMLERMANLVRLKDIDQQMCFIGGLDNGKDCTDGQFAYCWADHLTQVVFHVSTLMPTRERDPQCNNKFSHIGNDFVCIVYNESGKPFARTTIAGEKAQFLKVCIVITPLDCGVNEVEIQAEQEMDRIIGLQESFMISDQNLPLIVRQIAIHANLAYRQQFETAKRAPGDSLPFVSNWVERLRHMKRLKAKLLSSTQHSPVVSIADLDSGSGHRPRSMTSGTCSMVNASSLTDGPDSEYPDDFTTFTTG